ncbi:hypothetical protein MPSEU_000206400 [Mayamaea pseudoterrestris]|nr:hypothetical protein MPSEU_000206400 [Mayamaea pseudoterrestris]
MAVTLQVKPREEGRTNLEGQSRKGIERHTGSTSPSRLRKGHESMGEETVQTRGLKHSPSSTASEQATTLAVQEEQGIAPPPSDFTSASSFNDRPMEVVIAREKNPPAPDDDSHRAVHRIRLSALQHNYAHVEAAANRQQCSVITVIKADGYGHGAIATALYLADVCGADAFAVATLEEAIALRKAFYNNPPGRWSKQLASAFHTQDPHLIHGPDPWNAATFSGSQASSTQESATPEETARIMRPTRIRILVLGPPVGFPRCFDDYYHYNIELMVSGPEVAKSLFAWVADENERKRTQVERSANELKAKALYHPSLPRDFMTSAGDEKKTDSPSPNNGDEGLSLVSHQLVGHKRTPSQEAQLPRFHSSTLGNVSGQDLAREVRALLIQKASSDALQQHNQNQPKQAESTPISTVNSSCENSIGSSDQKLPASTAANGVPRPPGTCQAFVGVEQAARISRNRAAVVNDGTRPRLASGGINAIVDRRALRWHALVDSGMGRLGFRTEPVKDGDDRQDTVDVIKELVDCEINKNAPIEFFGMCTHMAEASSTSDYTQSQIDRFICLLKRVREAKIFVPTISTDNSAALLTQELTHFDPSLILSQAHASTRGYVRTGGAVYGQRPAFRQLRAVSTLVASVRHVAIIKKGESVGYDRGYTAPFDVRIATLTVGFADGYPRELGNGVGKVAIRNAVYPVVGNVCMDLLMIELGPADDSEVVGASVAVGDTAVLWGPMDEDDDEGLVRLQDLASTLKTTQSALTCGLDKIRVRRQFI